MCDINLIPRDSSLRSAFFTLDVVSSVEDQTISLEGNLCPSQKRISSRNQSIDQLGTYCADGDWEFPFPMNSMPLETFSSVYFVYFVYLLKYSILFRFG